MASKDLRPTPPPGGPALTRPKAIARPALGALLFGLSGMACGDDGGDDETAGNTEQPPMPGSEGPMPNPTSDATSVAPMIPPDTTTTTGDSADTGSSTDGGTEIPPMVPPDTTTSDGSSGSGSGSDSGSTGPIPPMPPPPDSGAAPDEPEI